MNSPTIKLRSRVKAGHQQVAKTIEGIKMSLQMLTTEAKCRVYRGARTITLGMAIRGLAIGVLLVAGTGMYFSMDPGDAMSSPTPSQREAIIAWQLSHLPGIDRLDDQIAAGLETDFQTYRSVLPEYAPAVNNLTSADPDTAELPYDELTRNFFGVTSPGREISANLDEDVAELPYDELTENFFGISSYSVEEAANLDEDTAVLPYDELTRNFFGVTSPGREIATSLDEDLAELPYDELTENFFGITVIVE